jgi:tetratricopeptide (TPR) repeat protein
MKDKRSSRMVWLWAVLVALSALPVLAGTVSVGTQLAALAPAVAVLVVLVVTHELGHALVGKLLGYRIFEVSIGLGPRLLNVPLSRTRVVVNLLPIGGHTLLAPRSARLLPARDVFVSLAGAFVNLFMVLGALTADLSNSFTFGIVLVGSAIVVENLLPRHVRNPLGVMQSDGMRAALALGADDQALADALIARYMGEAYVSHQAGDHAGALSWDERGLQAHPGARALEGDAAVALIYLHRYAEGRAKLRSLLERDDLSPIHRALCLNNLAWADLMLGDPAFVPEAIESSKEAIATIPDQPAFKGTRAYALILQGAVEDGLLLAREALRGNRRRDDRASNACVLAIGNVRAGRLDAARRHIVTAMRLSPENGLIERAIAELDAAEHAAAPHPG